MTIDLALKEFEDIFPELNIIAKYQPDRGIAFKKHPESEKNALQLMFEHILTKPSGAIIQSLKIDNGGQSGFYFFLNLEKRHWIILGSSAPIFGLLNLFVKQLQIEVEDLQKISEATPLINETKEVESTYRMQKQFLRKINWLSPKIKQKGLFFSPINKVSGCIYWYKNFKDSVIIAMADTKQTGMEGAMTTFKINELLNEHLESADIDLAGAIEKISKHAHSHNLKITSDEDLKSVKSIEIGLLNIDYKSHTVQAATNGIIMAYGLDNKIDWLNPQSPTDISKLTVSINEISPFAIMNKAMAEVYGMDALQDLTLKIKNEEKPLLNRFISNHIEEQEIKNKISHDMAFITINQFNTI